MIVFFTVFSLFFVIIHLFSLHAFTMKRNQLLAADCNLRACWTSCNETRGIMVNMISETSGRNKKHSQRMRKKISVWRTVMMLFCCLRLCPTEEATSFKDGEVPPPGGVARCWHKRAGHTHRLIYSGPRAPHQLFYVTFIRKF